MSTEIKTLLGTTTTVGPFTGEKAKGAGYQRGNDCLHTIVAILKNWSGEIRIQGTLSLYPGEQDWFDLADTNGNTIVIGDGSTDYDDRVSVNTTGRFVWIRAVGTISAGEITEIRYNY